MFLLHQFEFLANFFHEEAQSIKPTKGFQVKSARPGVKPANKELRTTVGDKVNMFTVYTTHSDSQTTISCICFTVWNGALQFGFCVCFVVFFFYYC